MSHPPGAPHGRESVIAARLDTRIVEALGRPAIVCATLGHVMHFGRLSQVLGAPVEEAGSAGLEGPFRGASAPIPPLGKLLGIPLFFDELATLEVDVAFGVFTSSDTIEITYADFARVEEPRIVPFASPAEELAPHGLP